jgi:hypothetical protein
MARNSADVVDHEVDAVLSADDHEHNEAEALAAINASWFDDSERTDVLEPRHLLAQLLPHAVVAPEARREPESERPIVFSTGLPPGAAEDPKWDAENEESFGADVDRLAPWEEPDLTDSAAWEEEAQTAYFERTANFELLDSKFVSEYTDRLPGGLAELVSSDAEPATFERSKPVRESGVRESVRVVPTASIRDDASELSDAEDREQSEHFAYEVSPSARAISKHATRSVPTPASKSTKAPQPRSSRPTVASKATAKRRTGSATIRERDRGRTAPARQSIPSDSADFDFDADALEFDEASVATVRGGRRFVSKRETPSQLKASLQRKAAEMEASRRPVQRTSPSRPAVTAPAQWLAAQNTPVPSHDTGSQPSSAARTTRPSLPVHASALPLAAGFDSDIAELREHRRDQAAAWLWVGASMLAGVALILVVRAWTNGSLATVEAPQQPTVAVETTVSAVQQAETGFAITTRPEGAQIYVDGQPTGFITPARVRRLTPGLHSVELKLGGYYDTSLPAALQENTMLELAPVEMRERPSASDPAAEAAPTGGIVPQLAAAAPRSHARRGEWRRWRQRGISRNAPIRRLNDDASDRASVASGEGMLRINSRPWARVMVDNKFVGNTPQRGLRVASGEHNVRLVNEPLNMSKTFHVTVRDGETVTRVEMLNEDAEQSHVSRASSRDAYAKAGR